MDEYSLSAMNKIFYSLLFNLKMHHHFLEPWINTAQHDLVTE